MNSPVSNSTLRIVLSVLVLSLLGMAIVQSQDDEPLPLYALPDANTPVFQSGSLALSEDNRTALAANMLNGTLSVLNLREAVAVEVATGADPRSVAFTLDQTRALVVNRGDGSLAVVDILLESAEDGLPVVGNYLIGESPYAVVTDNNRTAFVSVQSTHEVVEVDLTTGEILSRIALPDMPAGLTLWGDFLYVTHLWSGQVSLIYLPQMAVVRTVSMGQDVSLSQTMAINPRNGIAYLPQSRSNAQNVALTFDTTIFPVLNALDLAGLNLGRDARVTLDYADRPVNMPFDVALDVIRNLAFVVNAGSDSVSVVDLATELAIAHIPVGANPRGIRLSRDGGTAYVHNMVDGSVMVINARTFEVTDVLPVSDLTISADVFFGVQLFHAAGDDRMSRDSWVSCASCHFDGLSDGRIWRGISEDVTPAISDAEAVIWTGEWEDLRYLERKIRQLQGGRGLIDAMITPNSEQPDTSLLLDIESLSAYLQTLNTP